MKSVKNFRYVEKTSAECNEDSYLAILHLLRVELHCKLQEKLHRVTWPLEFSKRHVFLTRCAWSGISQRSGISLDTGRLRRGAH